MYLLDTNVLSATAPTKTRPDRGVQAWIRRHSDHLFLSTITLLELSYGLTWLRHRAATAKANQLAAWMDLVCFHYAARILPIDMSVALRAGALITLARANGVQIDTEDALIAATADLRSLIVLTDNVRHFAPTGVAHLNPFDRLPPDDR
jgi:predicted nucleic acid-binding protein